MAFLAGKYDREDQRIEYMQKKHKALQSAPKTEKVLVHCPWDPTPRKCVRKKKNVMSQLSEITLSKVL
jgi:hypothetical protein